MDGDVCSCILAPVPTPTHEKRKVKTFLIKLDTKDDQLRLP